MSTKNPIPSAPHFTMHYKSTISERFSPPFHSPDCCTSKWEKACTNGKKSKADKKSMAGFLLYVLGREEKEQENVFLVHHFVFFLCHPSRDVRIPSSISRSTRKSIDFSSDTEIVRNPSEFCLSRRVLIDFAIEK